MDYEVSLRRSEAALIEVAYSSDILEQRAPEDFKFNTLDEEVDEREVKPSASPKTITVALVGNPNAGKTSLFNMSSGAHERVGNYGGVTVDLQEGYFNHKGYKIRIIDLPGTYSLSAYTPEELYVRRYIVEQKPDVIVNVVAA